ncbi:hypothetical protein JAAARDRAFT_328889 [Jaapia argillacea MUCL 33604]|uniref:Protein kinase domain-containing protein n=1 Tax=Jaapia argillacea MUCL 33604 TaxID=933084 RepID=A0A067PWU1_9AGAM|nr:hypothetical protein JAAARDRAFT_328889 [Jaapia argillacea MUCL 33604]
MSPLRDWIKDNDGFATLILSPFVTAFVLYLHANSMFRSYLYVSLERTILFTDFEADSLTRTHLKEHLNISLRPYTVVLRSLKKEFKNSSGKIILLPEYTPYSLFDIVRNCCKFAVPDELEQFEQGFEKSIFQWQTDSRFLTQPKGALLKESTTTYFRLKTLVNFKIRDPIEDEFRPTPHHTLELLLRWLEDMLKSADACRFISQLRGKAAASYLGALSEAHRWMQDPQFANSVFREVQSVQSVRQQTFDILLSLSKSSYEFPPSIKFDGEIKCDEGSAAGSGGFATVARGTWLRAVEGSVAECREGAGEGNVTVKRYIEDEVAVKTLAALTSEKRADVLDWARKLLRQECVLWSQLNHPSIVRFYGVWDCVVEVKKDITVQIPRMILEWVGTDMRTYTSRTISNYHIDRLLLDIAAGLKYLNTLGAVHGDISSNNILVTPDGHAKLCDFGLATIAESLKPTMTVPVEKLVGYTLPYTAPEMLELINTGGISRATHASDIYAFAIICWELYSGTDPFRGRPESEVNAHVCGGHRLDRPAPRTDIEMTDDLWALVQDCWNQDPLRRPQAQKVLRKLRAFKVDSKGNDR